MRATVADVYAAIVSDLLDAEADLLADNGIFADQMAAKGLLAKVYLEMGDFANAKAKAAEVIGSGSYSLEQDLTKRFNDHPNTSLPAEFIFTLVSTNEVVGGDTLVTSAVRVMFGTTVLTTQMPTLHSKHLRIYMLQRQATPTTYAVKRGTISATQVQLTSCT